MNKTYAYSHEPAICENSRARRVEKVLNPKSSANIRLLEKMELLKETRDERLHSYLNKIIKNVKNGKLELH